MKVGVGSKRQGEVTRTEALPRTGMDSVGKEANLQQKNERRNASSDGTCSNVGCGFEWRLRKEGVVLGYFSSLHHLGKRSFVVLK